MRSLLLSALTLSLSGCVAPPVASEVVGQEYTYACAGGKSFHVGFDEGFSFARVTTSKATYQVPAVIAASGSRYSDGKVEFWEHHGEAMLNGVPGDAYEDCKVVDPT